MLFNARTLGKCLKLSNSLHAAVQASFPSHARTKNNCLWSLLRPRYCVLHIPVAGEHSGLSSDKDSRSHIYLQGRDDISVSDSIRSQEAALPTKHWRIRQKEFNRKIPVGESILQELESVFGMTRHEAVTTVQSPKFFLVADAVISSTLHSLKDFDITSKQLQRMPWILLQTPGEVASKISKLSEPYLFQNYFEGLGFCYFPLHKIRQYQRQFESEWEEIPHHNNRIYYIADQLMVPVDLLTEKIVKVHRLLSIDLHRIEVYIALLNKYNVQREDILNDLWIFFNNMDIAEKRLQAIIRAGCKRPKLWMCRCTEEVFERTLNRYQSQKDVLGECRSLEEYLIMRLGCSLDDLRDQGEFDHTLRRMNVPKLKKMIDMLLQEGFSTKQILHSLRLLKYSEHRTRTRIQRLKDLGVTKIIPSTLYKSPRSFESYCNSLQEKEK